MGNWSIWASTIIGAVTGSVIGIVLSNWLWSILGLYAIAVAIPIVVFLVMVMYYLVIPALNKEIEWTKQK